MASFTLTSGADTFVGSPGDNTVYGTAATLTAGDSLTGGSGTNVLDLIGSGSFDITQLAKFVGFQRINLNNPTTYYASLVLNDLFIEVDAAGYAEVLVNSPSNWNSRDIIHGDTSYNWNSTELVFNNAYPYTPVTYDLTSATLSRVDIYGGFLVTFVINNSVTAGVQHFYGANGDQLATSDATLDLSQTRVNAFTVVSTNPQGTTFTVGDLGTGSRSPAVRGTTP